MLRAYSLYFVRFLVMIREYVLNISGIILGLIYLKNGTINSRLFVWLIGNIKLIKIKYFTCY